MLHVFLCPPVFIQPLRLCRSTCIYSTLSVVSCCPSPVLRQLRLLWPSARWMSSSALYSMSTWRRPCRRAPLSSCLVLSATTATVSAVDRMNNNQSRDYNCDSTTIRRYHDAFDYDGSDHAKLRFAFDSTAIRLRHDYDEKLTCSFFACVEWKKARAIRRSRIVVGS